MSSISTMLANSATASSANVNAQAAASTASSSMSGALTTGSTMTEQNFLTLLVTQLKNQNPAQPVSNSQLAQEIAGFTTASGVDNADKLLQQISSQLTALTAAVQTVGSKTTSTSGSTTKA
ncbi:hypothetical protein HAP94_11245 [Acidithiobacillus ferrivorans]|nr:hypothetical protein [Acidithiobacillus ferrivorans]